MAILRAVDDRSKMSAEIDTLVSRGQVGPLAEENIDAIERAQRTVLRAQILTI